MDFDEFAKKNYSARHLYLLVGWAKIDAELRKAPASSCEDLAKRLGWSYFKTKHTMHRMVKRGMIRKVHRWEAVDLAEVDKSLNAKA